MRSISRAHPDGVRWRLARTVWCLLAVAACTPRATALPSGGYHGIALDPARPKPDFTLVATDGRPFHFAADTHGIITLLYFGYTYCPDVCPVHMANIAEVLHQMPPEDQERVRVVFVTTDPTRDTPTRLRAWLDNFDPRFIGLIGDMATVNRIQEALGLPPAVPEVGDGPRAPGGPAYGVGHLLFTPDDSLRLEYPFGTRQADWSADLTALIAAEPKPK